MRQRKTPNAKHHRTRATPETLIQDTHSFPSCQSTAQIPILPINGPNSDFANERLQLGRTGFDGAERLQPVPRDLRAAARDRGANL